MRNIALLLLLQLCTTHGRRVPPLAERQSGKLSTNDASDGTQSLATALLALNPGLAFMPSSLGRSVHASEGTAGLAGSQRPLLEQRSRRATHLPVMHHIEGESHELTPKELAARCLEQGCPVDTVEELLAALKAEKSPSAELTSTISELEKLLVEPNANKNAIEKLVAAVANSYTMPSEVIGAFSEALSRSRRSSAPKMHHIEGENHELTPKQLAAKCLEQGCPVDTVEELLAALKAEESPSAELTSTITDLEQLLVEPDINKNAIEKLVAEVNSLGDPMHEFTTYPIRGQTELDAAKMKVSSSSADLADMCLKEGCPTNLVFDLVIDLKKTRNPTAELTQTIKELEELLAQENAKKNKFKKLILSMARDFQSFDKKLFGAAYP